jgi:hypothetical protein
MINITNTFFGGIMKFLTFSALLLLLVSCNDNEYLTVEQVNVVESQEFEGFYYCDNSSQIELLVDFADRVTIETTGQSLNSINPKNGTLGTHPVIGDRDLLMNGNKLIINPRNYHYSSLSHDIEEDLSGNNITGHKRTDIEISKTDGGIQILIKIYAGAVNQNINNIIAERTINCTL